MIEQYNILVQNNGTRQMYNILPELYAKYNECEITPISYEEIKSFILSSYVNNDEINYQITNNIDIITDLFIKYGKGINRINIKSKREFATTFIETFQEEMLTLLLDTVNKIIKTKQCGNDKDQLSYYEETILFYDLKFTYLNDLKLNIKLFNNFEIDWNNRIDYYIDKSDNMPSLDVWLSFSNKYDKSNEEIISLLNEAICVSDAIGQWQRSGGTVSHNRHFVFQDDKQLKSMSEEDREIWLKNSEVLFSGKGGIVTIPLNN